MMRTLLRLLFPPKCVFCGRVTENENFAVCEDCLPHIPLNRRACRNCGTPLDTVYGDWMCTTCRKRKRAFTRAYVPFVYKDIAREAILRFKFGGRRGSAGTLAAYILLKMREMRAPRPDMITFVPLHFTRLGVRGYNQTALLARALGKMLGVPVQSTLRKMRNTPPQSKMSGRNRWAVQHDVFALKRDVDVAGKDVLLVDDVITTGATMHTCARHLKKAGAKTVEIAAAAATSFVHK